MSSAPGRKAFVVGIGGLVLALLLTGVWHATADESSDPHLVGDAVRVLVDGNRDSEINGAGVSGQLRLYAPERCLVLDAGDYRGPRKDPVIQEIPASGRVTWAGPIWPYGSEVIREGDRYGVRTSDGSTYWMGDYVSGGGGSWPRKDDGKFRSFGLPQNCIGISLDQFKPDGPLPQEP